MKTFAIGQPEGNILNLNPVKGRSPAVVARDPEPGYRESKGELSCGESRNFQPSPGFNRVGYERNHR